jgi:hypothetical protein
MHYKFLLGQPAQTRFIWESEVLLTNIRNLDKDVEIIMVFDDQNPEAVAKLRDKYNIQTFEYKDERADKSYAASTRPYLFWRYFSEDASREKGTYFQIETDIIFRELPKIPKLKGKMCIGSDCGGYLDYNYYITRDNGQQIVDGFCSLLNIDEQLIKDTPGIGAQYVYSNPTAQLWWHIWQDSDILYRFINTIEGNVQRWTMEMNAQLYNFAKFGWEVEIESELEFCRPTDNVKMWDAVKILHNAGVIGELGDFLFYKGKYIFDTPFQEDLSWVRRDKAGWHYARAIEKVVL